MAKSKVHSYRPKKFKVKKGESLWLLSFTDLSMILISFFIVMLSYSTVNQKKADNVQTAVENPKRPENNLKALQERIESEVKKQGLQASANVTFDADGLSVEFKDNLLFASGSAQADPKFAKVVGSVMNVIADAPTKYKLIFEGHTDDTPVLGGQFGNNWDLSAARGISLLKQFEQRGVTSDRMSVTAFADTRPKIVLAGLKKKQLADARAINRRVVIRIE